MPALCVNHHFAAQYACGLPDDARRPCAWIGTISASATTTWNGRRQSWRPASNSNSRSPASRTPAGGIDFPAVAGMEWSCRTTQLGHFAGRCRLAAQRPRIAPRQRTPGDGHGIATAGQRCGAIRSCPVACCIHPSLPDEGHAPPTSPLRIVTGSAAAWSLVACPFHVGPHCGRDCVVFSGPTRGSLEKLCACGRAGTCHGTRRACSIKG